MPSVVKLNSPVMEMKFYYNVTQKVGPYADKGAINDPLDVELVNLLLSLGYPSSSDWPSKMKPGAISRGPTIDTSTAFMIYVVQDWADEAGPWNNNSRPDGMVSVGNASGSYGAGTIFTIVFLNLRARKTNPSAWLKLYNYPGISSALKAKITHAYTS